MEILKTIQGYHLAGKGLKAAIEEIRNQQVPESQKTQSLFHLHEEFRRFYEVVDSTLNGLRQLNILPEDDEDGKRGFVAPRDLGRQ